MSNFVIGAMEFNGTFSNSISFGGIVARAVGGIVLFITGIVITKAGALGAAGSGLILNPRRARKDLSPYSRMVGGMIKDGLEESGLASIKNGNSSSPEKIVMLKCTSCGQLNEDDSKFCQECGKKL